MTAVNTRSYVQDPDRLEALARSGLMSEDFEPAFDRWTRLAASLVGAPKALLTLVDGEHAFTKSQASSLLSEPAAGRASPVTDSFCQHVVADRAPFVVSDARADLRVSGLPAVADEDVAAYAGQPVVGEDGHVLGAFCVVDTAPRDWTAHELGLLEDLAAGLIAEVRLRAALRTSNALRDELAVQARFDALTGIANRRQLADDLGAAVSGDGPQVLAMFDLDGFKLYNDTFGHPAGDALLARLAGRLATVVGEAGGTAYRLGGDEFCVLVHDDDAVSAACRALRESGDSFSIGSSFGVVRLDDQRLSVEQAMQLVDQRLYDRKHGRSDAARRQAQDVLASVLREREPELDQHVHQVAELVGRVAERLGLDRTSREQLRLAAQMHDIGKVAVPDSILTKGGPLDASEWKIMRQHTLFGERILSAAPALQGAAPIVRSSHERWDGGGYPDGLAGQEIPLGSRIVLACDAYDAMTSDRPYARARSSQAALAELRENAGTQFDPEVVTALVAAL